MSPVRVGDHIVISDAELRWRFSRSGGPGGQSVNTADSRVELSFDLLNSTSMPAALKARALARLGSRLIDGVLSVSAQEHRSQLKNRHAAERRMGEILEAAVAAPKPPRRPTKPSRSAKRARVESKLKRGAIKRLRRSKDDG